MDSINSWINEEEVRKLADELASIAKVSAKLDDDGDFGAEEFVEANQPEKLKKECDAVSASEADTLPNERKIDKSRLLATASARAASVGLLDPRKSSDSVASAQLGEAKNTTLCDRFIHAVPVNVGSRDKDPVSVPAIHNKGIGTFGDIDKLLTDSVEANGICVIDSDSDVLYSSLENQHLVGFTIDTMKKSKLMLIEDGEVGNIRLRLSAEDFFEFVSVKSTRGVIILVVKMKKGLGSKRVKKVAGDILKITNLV